MVTGSYSTVCSNNNNNNYNYSSVSYCFSIILFFSVLFLSILFLFVLFLCVLFLCVLALFLSGLLNEGITYVPAGIKRAIEGTASSLGTHPQFSIGRGVIQVLINSQRIEYFWRNNFILIAFIFHFRLIKHMRNLWSHVTAKQT